MEQNSNPTQPNKRRKFIKRSALASFGLSLPIYGFPRGNWVFESDLGLLTTEERKKELTLLLRTRKSLDKASDYSSDEMADELAKNLIILSFLEDSLDDNGKFNPANSNLLKDEFTKLKSATPIDMELAKQQAIQPVFPEFYVLGARYIRDAAPAIAAGVGIVLSGAAKAVKSVNWGKAVRRGKKFIVTLGKEFAEEFVESYGDKAGEIAAKKTFGEGKELSDYDINQMNEACKKQLYQLAEEYDEIRTLFDETELSSELGLDAIGMSLNDLVDELEGDFKTNVQSAIDEKFDDIKAYFEKELQKKSAETVEGVVNAIIKKEADAAQKRKDWQEYQSQAYIGKFIAQQIFDPQTAREISATVDFGMQIATLVAMGAGPWAMAAGFLSGAQSLNAVFGKKQQDPNNAIFSSLKKIQETLKFITEQLTTIQENQQKILEEIIVVGDRLAYQNDNNTDRIREDLSVIEAKVNASIETNIEIEKDNDYRVFNIAARNIGREIQNSRPRFQGTKGIYASTDVVYTHAIATSSETEFNGYLSSWNSVAINDSLQKLSRFDLGIAKITNFLEETTGKQYELGNSAENRIRKPINPYEWAKATTAMAETLMHFPQLAKHDDGIFLTQLSELKEVGIKISDDLKKILKKENIDKAFSVYEQNVETVINNCVDSAVEAVSQETLLNTSKEGTDTLHFHEKHLFGNYSTDDFHTAKNPKRVTKVSEIPNSTIKGLCLEKNKECISPEDKRPHIGYYLKAESNLYMEPGSYDFIGNFYTTNKNNPINIGEKLGLISLAPSNNPHIPLNLDLSGNDSHNYYYLLTRLRRKGIKSPPSIIDIGFRSTPNTKATFNVKSSGLSDTRFRFSSYKIRLKGSSNPSNDRVLGNETDGWTIAQLMDLDTEEQCDAVSFWSDHLHGSSVPDFGNKQFKSTKEVLDLIELEVKQFYHKNKNEVISTIPQKIATYNDSSASEYEGVASSLQLLGAVSHWNNGGSFEQANEIQSNHGYLFSRLAPENEEVEKDPLYPITVKSLFQIVMEEHKPNEDDPISIVDHAKNKMLEIAKENAKRFRKNFFFDNPEETPGIPEVNIALEMIKQVENTYSL